MSLLAPVEARPLKAPVVRAGNTVFVKIGMAFAGNPASSDPVILIRIMFYLIFISALIQF